MQVLSKARLRRGLPPGSLSVVSSLRSLFDRRYYLEASKRFGPVFRTRQQHRPTVCVVGLDRANELLHEHGDSLGGATHRYTDYVTGGFLRFMEGDAHSKYNGIFRNALRPTVVEAAQPDIREVARRELLLMADDCAGGRHVPPWPYLARIAHDAVARALFGLVPGEPAYEEFAAAYEPIGAQNLSRRFTRDAKEALQNLRSLVDAQAQRLRAGGGTEAEAGSSVGQMVALDLDLPDLTCIDNLVFALRIGSSDVAGLLAWMFALVGSDPALTRRLAGLRGNDSGARDLAERLMCETLRLAQSEYLYRTIKHDIEFEGHRLPSGWLLRICVWESHRDPAVFADPERFDPDRFVTRAFRHSEYAPFGSGPHHCIGVGVTTATCRAVFEELAAGYDWGVEWDGKATRRRRHWGHWRPSSSLRVRVRPA